MIIDKNTIEIAKTQQMVVQLANDTAEMAGKVDYLAGILKELIIRVSEIEDNTTKEEEK